MRSKNRTFLKRSLAKLLALVMVLSLLPVVPVGADEEEQSTVATETSEAATESTPEAEAGGEEAGGSSEAGGEEAGDPSEASGEETDDPIEGEGETTDPTGGDLAGETTDPAEETHATETVTVKINISDAEVIAVEIDDKNVEYNKEEGAADTVAVKDSHTVKALIHYKNGDYAIVETTESANDGVLSVTFDDEFLKTNTPTVLASTGETEKTVTLNAESEGTGGTDDGKLLVTWNAISKIVGNNEANSTFALMEESEVADVSNENTGLIFSNVGNAIVQVDEFSMAADIASAKIVRTKVTVEVQQVATDAAKVTADASVEEGKLTVGTPSKLTVDVKSDEMGNYEKLKGNVTYALTEESEAYAGLSGNVLTPNKANENSDAQICLNVEVADSTFFKGVTVKSNDITIVRKKHNIDKVVAITTDVDVLNQIGVYLPEVSSEGQRISYKVRALVDGTYVESSYISVSDEYKLVVSDDENAVGTWYIYATSGNEIYQNVEKTVELTVGAKAYFAEETVQTDWLSLEDRTYTQTIVDDAGHDWRYQITSMQDSNGKAVNVSDPEAVKAVAEIDDKTGTVTMNTAGVVTVQASRVVDEASNVYVTHEYTLTVNKSQITPVFMSGDAKIESEELYYGVKDSYTFPLKMVTEKGVTIDVPAEADISWKLDGNNSLNLNVPEKDDENNFTVKLGNQTGSASTTFTVSINENAYYKAASNSTEFTLSVNVDERLLDGTELGEMVVLSDPNGEEEWYVPAENQTAAENVAFEAKDGYAISLTGEFINETGAWESSKTLADVVEANSEESIVGKNEEGRELGKDQYIYVRDTGTGAIYKYALPGYKVDNTAPTMTVSYSRPVNAVVLDTITRLFYSNEKQDSRNLTVTVTPVDTENGSGIATVSWGKKNETTDEATNETIDNTEFTEFESGKEYESGGTYKFVLYNIKDFESALRFKVVDNAGLETVICGVNVEIEGKDQQITDAIVVVDSVTPKLTVTYESDRALPEKSPNGFYSKSSISVKLSVEEDYFWNDKHEDKFNVTVKEKINGNEIEVSEDYVTWSSWSYHKDEETGKETYDAELTLTNPNDGKEHEYYLSVDGTDLSGNAFEQTKDTIGICSGNKYTSPALVLDNVAPKISVTYLQDPSRIMKTNSDGTYAVLKKESDSEDTIVYKGDDADETKNAIVAKIEVDETYFDSKDFTANLDGNKYALDDWSYDKNKGVYTATVELPVDEGQEVTHDFNVSGTDIARNQIVADTVQYGTVENGEYQSKKILIDDKAPEISVKYDKPARTMKDSKVAEIGNSDTLVYKDDDVTAEITITEQYFDATDFTVSVNKEVQNVEWKTDGDVHTAVITLNAEKKSNKSYVLSVTGTDIATNQMKDRESSDTGGTDENGAYTSKNILIDSTTPEVEVTYDKTKSFKRYVDGDEVETTKDKATTYVYNGNVVATVEVTEAYFDPGADWTVKVTEDGNEITGYSVKWDDKTATITINAAKDAEHIYHIFVKGQDIAGHPFTYTTAEHGKFDNESGEYTSKELLIDTRAPQVTIAYTDRANSGAQKGFYTDRSAEITVEDASFDSSSETGTYSVSVSGVNAKEESVTNISDAAWTYGKSGWTSAIDFGEEANYTFTLTISDNAGNLAAFSVDKNGDSGDQNTKNGDGKYTTQFTVDRTPPEELTFSYSTGVTETLLKGVFYRFYNKDTKLTVTVEAKDSVSGVREMSYSYDRSAGASDVNNKQFDVDYGPYGKFIGDYELGWEIISESNVYDGNNKGQLNGQFSYTVMDYAGNIRSTSDAEHTTAEHETAGLLQEVVDTISPTATITYSGYSNVSSTTNNENPNGEKAYYFPVSSKSVPITITEANFYAEDITVSVSRNGAAYQTADMTWTSTGKDTYTGYVTLSEPNSYYYIKVQYKDKSANAMSMKDDTNGTSGDWEYTTPRLVLDTTAPVVSVSYSGSYRSGDMDYYNSTAVATIRVKEKNFSAAEATQAITISGQNIDGGATGVPTVSGWSYVGSDTYSATITYSTDSRYTFDMHYSDLAKLSQSGNVKKNFAVDKTAPANLGISYSTDVWGLVNSGILWYDTPVQVTLTASDMTAGVETITYSYMTKAGVSTVNVGMDSVSVSVDANSSSVQYTFSIPASVLVSTNQFNGTVSFTAVDRSGNSTSFDGTNELVVDNIAPNASITFTEPVSSDDTTDYYSTPFEARIEINEANFDPDMVTITVEKDGEPYTNFTYSFTDESVDVHVATIRFTENGEYVIRVSYTDMSKNEMVSGDGDTNGGTYTSRIKIVDVDAPAIEIKDMLGRVDPDQIAYDSENTDSNGTKHERITFTVSFEDDNLLEDGLDVSLSGFMPLEGKDATQLAAYDYVDVTERYVAGTAAVVAEGESYTISISNIEEDAVYFLKCSATDQAGNFADDNIMFSVNRDGSTYYITDAATNQLLKDFWTNSTTEVEIHEISVEDLSQTGVTVVRDSTSSVLEQDKDYDVDRITGKDENWNDYSYSVYASNFESEGAYTVQTNSKTELKENGGTEKAYSSADEEQAAVRFVMDVTAPEAYISGILENKRYNASEQPITVTLSDNTQLASAVLTIDGSGQEIMIDDSFSGSFETAVPAKNHDQTVSVMVTDKAGNAYELSMENIRVTTNVFYLYLEYFIIGAIILLLMIAILIGVIISRKKKRETTQV